MKTGLFFGSFNPIHLGHLMIAGYMLEFTDIDELWFVVSPHNPLKEKSELADDFHRLEMVKLAIKEFSPKMQVCEIEMSLPKPSYTVNTLKVLKEKYPEKEFVVIMGSDSMDTIEKWKDYKTLLEENSIYVYPRLGSDLKEIEKKYPVTIINAPVIEISSTFIRNSLKDNKNMEFFLPSKVLEYLQKNCIYKTL